MKNAKPLWVALLLADPSPSLRLLVLRELLGASREDTEVIELTRLCESEPLVTDLQALQREDGSWIQSSPSSTGGLIQETAQALSRFGYFGMGSDFLAVHKGAEFLFSQQRSDGAWPLSSEIEDSERYQNYDMIPLQTAMPLRGLAACGYATDPHAEKAYDWLLEQRLEDGTWPTGISSGNFGRVAGYRRLPHSRWGCRTNTTEVLRCLALHPNRRSSPESQRALDHILARETRERDALGVEIARTIGAEPTRGLFTYHARYDSALSLDLCWRIGAGLDDPRIADLVSFLREIQGPYGLWEHTTRPQVSRWLTFDLIRSLTHLDETSAWISLEPRTPFRAYPQHRKRY
jgi:hypothetical protein